MSEGAFLIRKKKKKKKRRFHVFVEFFERDSSTEMVISSEMIYETGYTDIE